LRARAQSKPPRFFCSPKGFKVLRKAQRVVRGLSAPIKKDIRVIRISTREVSVSEGGTFEKYFLKNWFALCLNWCRSIATPKTDGV